MLSLVLDRPAGEEGDRNLRHPGFRGAWLACLFLVATGLGSARAARVEEPIGYRLGPCAGTEDKPQSKLWFHDGSFWAVLDTPAGNRILELSDDRWRPAADPATVLGGHDGRADVLWDGRRLIVLLFSHSPRLFEFGYVRSSRTWHRRPGYPVELPVPEGSETMVIAEDGRGRLWATYTNGGRVWVTHSTRNHARWDLPGRVLQEGITEDDISSVIAFGGNRIGVMWTDQERDEFGFRVHRDADPDSVWGSTESVDRGDGHADDHLHLCADRAGRVYAVTKDDEHRLAAHMRSPGGAWTSHEDLLANGHATRPILMTAPEDSLLVLLYTRWHEGAEVISCRRAPLGTLDFGLALTFIAEPDLSMNDVTGLRQPLPRGSLVAVATGGDEAWWNGWGVPQRRRHADPLPLVAHSLPRCPEAAVALAFDEAGHGDVIDASPHAARGHLGGPWPGDGSEPRRIAGVSGQALRFDGTYDFVEVPADTLLGRESSFTVQAWVRRASHDTKDTILCKGTPGERTFQVRLLMGDVVEFLREDPTGKNHTLEGRRTLADSLWHHIACVYDRRRGESRIYVDGRLDAAAPDSLGTAVNDDPLVIGARFRGTNVHDHFHGDIDEVGVFPFAGFASDFVPPASFESGRRADVFLDWTPRFTGPSAPTAFTVLRRCGRGPEERITAAPIHDTSWIDEPECTGRLTYRVVPEGPKSRGSAIELDWPPIPSAAAPPDTR